MEMEQREIDYSHMRALFTCGQVPGYYCVSSTTITECADGYYCPGGSIGDEVQCPVGVKCPKANLQEPCPTGYYSVLGDSYCHMCEAGSICNGGSKTACTVAGTYSLRGETSCTS